MRVVAPAIGLDVAIVPLGVDGDGALEVPQDYDTAGWHTGGPEPGESGPAVIAGHVDDLDGPAAFYRVRDLRQGDAIHVNGADGLMLTYTVDAVEQHPKSAFPTERVYGPTRETALRLITCGGAFDEAARSYRDNVVVYATIGRAS